VNPIVHAELSWLTGARLPDRRDRLLVTLAGLVPDVDGLSLLFGLEAYGKWHHVLTHGLVAAAVVTAVFAALARRRAAVAGLSFVAVHLHLLCDLAGSGPGWPITYLYPFDVRDLYWDGQWNLASWQNSVIGLAATLLVLWCAVPLGRTLLELVSVRWDERVVRTVRARFGR
jgi:ABC-type cobalamin transport system permease subunit